MPVPSELPVEPSLLPESARIGSDGALSVGGVDLAALAARGQTGEGQEVRTSLLQASLGFEIFNFFTMFAAQAANSLERVMPLIRRLSVLTVMRKRS